MPAIAERAASLIESERTVPRSLVVHAPSTVEYPQGATRLELTSRGDRVPVVLWRPDGAAPRPMVLLQYGAGGAIDAHHVAAVQPFLAAGLAVATVDWPLHGARTSAKLSERLLAGLDRADPDPNGSSLVEQFVLQSALDVSRTLEGATEMEGVDAKRIGLVGAGLGATLCALVAAIDPRVTALAVAPGTRGAAGTPVELGALLAEGPARPVLLLRDASQKTSQAEAIEALRAACPGKARIDTVAEAGEPIGPAAAAAAADFLAAALG